MISLILCTVLAMDSYPLIINATPEQAESVYQEAVLSGVEVELTCGVAK